MKITKQITKNLHMGMALPAILLFAFFFLYPLANGVWLSMTSWDGFSFEKEFIGLQNFVRFFSDERAVTSVLNTLKFALVVPAGINILGLAYALLLDQNLRGKDVSRTIIYLPAIVSPLIIGYIWRLILRPDGGALRDIMTFLGMGEYFQNWLSNPKGAMWVIMIANIWQYAGSAMIIYLAGLQGIPMELCEACRIDGANYWQKLWKVIVPLLVPAIKINVLNEIIYGFSVYDSVVAITDGGPGFSTETISLFIYRMSYGSHTGYGTAIALILLVIILVPTTVSYRWLTKHTAQV